PFPAYIVRPPRGPHPHQARPARPGAGGRAGLRDRPGAGGRAVTAAAPGRAAAPSIHRAVREYTPAPGRPGETAATTRPSPQWEGERPVHGPPPPTPAQPPSAQRG